MNLMLTKEVRFEMMFQEFMQMGAPAAIALVGIAFAISGTLVAVMIRNQTEQNSKRNFEIKRIQQASMAKQIDHKSRDEP